MRLCWTAALAIVVVLILVVKGFPSISLGFIDAVMYGIDVDETSTSYCNAKSRVSSVLIRIRRLSCFGFTALGTQSQPWCQPKWRESPWMQTWQATAHCPRVVETAET
ncbi:hypothetical protein BDV97DRAFT_351988 [Delphinella strobiligena]|nr:hypothetical protein BDV97DRAFT_351988 [Delphinella strobiligena]